MFKKILLAALLCAPLSALAQKVATFSYADVIIAIPEYKKAQDEVNGLAQKYQNEISAMQKEYQSKVESYQKEVNDQTPANVRERREQEIMELQQRIQTASNDNSQTLQRTSNEKMQPITEKILKAVNDVMAEGSYVFVMDENSVQQGGIFVNPKLSENVTNKVLGKLGITPAQAAAAKAAAQKAAQEAQAAAASQK